MKRRLTTTKDILEYDGSTGYGYGRSSGYIVQCKKSLKQGRTYHNQKLVFNKVRVYIMNDNDLTGEKLLCKPQNLQIIGFID